MASKSLLFLVILSLISCTIQDETDNQIDSEDNSPLADVAKQILKEKNLENIGGMVNGFLQSGGAKQLMDGVLQNLGSEENSGKILEGLASLLNSDGDKKATGGKEGKKEKKSKNDVNPIDLLSGIGSIVGAMQGAGGEGGNPADLLQGLGSLLGGKNNQGGDGTAALLQGLGSIIASASQEKGKKDKTVNNGADLIKGLGSLLGAAAGGDNNNGGALLQGLGSLLGNGKGGINQEMIRNMINMFTDTGSDETKDKKGKRAKAPKKVPGEKVKTKKVKFGKGDSNGLEGVLSLAKSFLGKNKGKKDDLENIDINLILENFPLILKMAKSFGGPKVKPYLEPLDDVITLFKDVTDEKKQFNFNDFFEKLLRIYKAYEELFVPYLKNLKSASKSNDEDESFDLGALFNLASGLLSQGGSGKGSASGGLMDYLPMIMNTINAFTGPEAQERADSHADHSWSLPPVLEKLHVYYDNFLNSDMGKYFFSFLGGQSSFTIFRDEKGYFNYTKFEELIENHSFRRHWIQQIVGELVKLLQVLSDKSTYSKYIEMSMMFTNSLFEKAGFPKNALINPKMPAKSITNFSNYVIKKYLGMDFETREYVEPVVSYIQEILVLTHKSISPGDQPKELRDKLTNTLNMEIIEPVTRVNRAYRFSKLQPECDKFVFCLINQEVASYPENLPTLKQGLYKGSSLVAAWFISSHTGTPFWDLYNIVTEHKNCNDFYKEVCNGFHEEEYKATTEYVHNEL